MSVSLPSINQPRAPANVQPAAKPKLTTPQAIRHCEDHFPDEFRRKKVFTLAIAIAGVAMLVIPALALALSALSICSFGVGLIAVALPSLVAISIVVKRVNDKTHYWTGKLAHAMIEVKEQEKEKAAKQKIKV